jgi:FdhD protein
LAATSKVAVTDKRSRNVSMTRYANATVRRERDAVAVEEPLEIRLGDAPLAVTMRTPGDDDDLVLGFLLTEGVLLDPTEVAEIEHREDARGTVRLRDDVHVDSARFQRNMFMSSSCGVCGKASIEMVKIFARPARSYTVRQDVVSSLTNRLRAHQPTFDATGGLHAAALFDLAGALLAASEDVGRHNAVDKAVGAASRQQWPLPSCLLAVSGRQSFEIVQKAAVAGIGGVVGVSAPSSLAVELAASLGLLLVGFSRGDTLNVYAGDEHLTD